MINCNNEKVAKYLKTDYSEKKIICNGEEITNEYLDEDVKDKFFDWQLGGKEFNDVFSSDDVEYMKNHLVTIATSIYRCEIRDKDFIKSLKVGDIVKYDRPRSFSKDESGFIDVLFMWDDAYNEDESIVCFKTQGPVNIFDADKEFELNYKDITNDDFGCTLNTQKEIFSLGTFKIVEKTQVYDDYAETYYPLFIIEFQQSNKLKNNIKEDYSMSKKLYSLTDKKATWNDDAQDYIWQDSVNKFTKLLNEGLNSTKQQSAVKSNGVYSVLHNKWIKEPVQSDIPDLDKEVFEKLFKEWEDSYFDLLNNINIDDYLSNDILEEKNKQLDSEKIADFIEDIYDLRKTSIAKDGEYSLGNLVFKEFRNLGYLDNLKELKNKLKSKELSLESSNNIKESLISKNSETLFNLIKAEEDVLNVILSADTDNREVLDKESYELAKNFIIKNGIKASGMWKNSETNKFEEQPDSFIIKCDLIKAKKLAKSLCQKEFITILFKNKTKFISEVYSTEDEDYLNYSKKYNSSDKVIIGNDALKLNGYTIVDNVCFSLGIYDNDKLDIFKKLDESSVKGEKTMTKYYIYDTVANDGDIPYSEFKTEKDFYDSLEYNYDIAKEYGDEVEDTFEEVKKSFEENADYEDTYNAFTYIKLTSTSLEEYDSSVKPYKDKIEVITMNESLSLNEEVNLPYELDIDFEDLPTIDDDMDEIIGDYLSDTFGYCHFGFDYEYDEDKNVFHVSNIKWDLGESLNEEQEILDVLGIEKNKDNSFYQNKEEIIKQYKELKKKYPDCEIYLKGDEPYWKKDGTKISSSKDLVVVKMNESLDEEISTIDQNKIKQWWKDVESLHKFNIDNDDATIEEMHSAMFDMLTDLAKEDSDEAKQLLKTGKDLYNKYALSKFTLKEEVKDNSKFESIKNKLSKILINYLISKGYEKSDFKDYFVIDIKEEDNNIHVQIRNDLVDYYDLSEEVMKKLDEVVEPDYFEPQNAYVWDAWISKESSKNKSLLDEEIEEESKEFEAVKLDEEDQVIESMSKFFDTKDEAVKFALMNDYDLVTAYTYKEGKEEPTSSFEVWNKEDGWLEESLEGDELESLANILRDHFESMQRYYEIYKMNDELYIDISWGDWKHDHLFVDFEVDKFLKEKGYKVVKEDTQLTDEDGSDTYSAIHIYKVEKI